MLKDQFDVVIVGGGISGCLMFHALKFHYPNINLLLIEKNSVLGGNHTWSFHHADVPNSCWPWLRPLISKEWTGYQVQFSSFQRVFNSHYYSIKSNELSEKTLSISSDQIWLNTELIYLPTKKDDDRFQLEIRSSNQTTHKIKTESVLLAQGWQTEITSHAWQKFVGLEIKLKFPHSEVLPTLIDARAPQIDGSRFFSILPINEYNLLVEDNYYSNHPTLKIDRIEQEIINYTQKKDWQIEQILRREHGALPLPFSSPAKNTQVKTPDEPACIGISSRLFHAMTGHSTSVVFKQIESICENSNLTNRSMQKALAIVDKHLQKQNRFFYLINKFIFKATDSAFRYKIFEYIYKLPAPLIERLFSAQLTKSDRLRILLGKPPISFAKALQVLRED